MPISCIGPPERDCVKQRHILLLSDHRPTATELPLCQGGRYRFTHCTSDAVRSAEIGPGVQSRYDWILIDGAMMGGDEKEFLQSLRAMGHLLSEGAGDCYQSGGCSLEWDANGTLQLRCAGRRLMRPARGCRTDRAEVELPGFTFEYHAPMKRTG